MNNSIDHNFDQATDEVFAKIEKRGYVAFPDFYKKRIAPVVNYLENSRVNACKVIASRKPWGIIIFIAITLVYGFFFKGYYFEEPIIGSYLVFVSLVLGWVYSSELKFKSDIKKIVYTEIFKFFDGFEYIPESTDHSNIESFERFGIIPDNSYCEAQDLILGNYKGVYFRFEEWKIDIWGQKSTEFEGVTILFNFNKNFVGQTVVLRKGAKPKIPKNSPNDLQKVELEDPEFQKMFDVYSTDQIEARYLITTAFMERIKSMRETFNNEEDDDEEVIEGGVEIAFCENKLLLMFDGTKDMFEYESCVSEKIDLFSESIKVIKQINSIFELIDYLKLDQKLGL